MNRKLYARIATALEARANCAKSGNKEWEQRHTDRAQAMVRAFMPSGSGVDSGTELDIAASSGERLVFVMPFHHMNDAGMYSGWTQHSVSITPSLTSGFVVRITGRNRNSIKDYLGELVHVALSRELTDVEAYGEDKS